MSRSGTKASYRFAWVPPVPRLGDVSDEDADEDGALLAAGYASITPVRGPHEDTDPAFDGVIHSALAAIDRHLETF